MRDHNNDDLPSLLGRIGNDTIRAKIKPTRMYLYNDRMETLGYVPIQPEAYEPKRLAGEYGLREYGARPAYHPPRHSRQRPLTEWQGDQP